MLRDRGSAVQVYDAGAPGGAYARSESAFDLKEIIKTLHRRRSLILITVVVITTITALAALSLAPRYVTVASVLIEQRRTNVVDGQATGQAVVEEATDSSTLAAEINLLRSRTYAQKVVEDLNLLYDPGFNPRLQNDTGPLAILAARLSRVSNWVPRSWSTAASELWSSWVPEPWLIAIGLAEQSNPVSDSPNEEGMARAQQVTQAPAEDAEPADRSEVIALPSPGTDAYENLMQSAVSTLLAGLRIKAGGNSLILIEFTSSDPRQAAEIADKVAELYVRDQLEIKQAAIDRAIDWLKQRVTALRERVLQSEGAVVAYREQNGLVGTETGQPERGGPGLELASIQAERAQKEELLNWVRELRGRGADLDTIAAVLSLPSLAALRQQDMELQRQETMLRMKYNDQHREIIQLESGRHPINIERQYLAERIAGEIRTAIRKLESEVAFARRQEEEIRGGLAHTVTEPTPDGQAEVQLRDLQRQADADRSLYVALLNRFKEVSEQRNLLDAGATVASRAGIPGEPEFPKPGLMTIAGFTVSLTLGGLLAFLIEYLDGGMRTGRQVEQVLGLPHLGFVPRISSLKRDDKLHQHLIKNPQSSYAEAIRSIQITTLDAIDSDHATKVILVTSSLPGEGKTTLALSLGASAACSGRKAVVVDLDLRRPRLHRETALTPGAGLVELLAGETELQEVLVASDDHPGLDILPVRRLPESPADLLRSPRMASLVTELRARYDYVVLDSPPLLGVVDAKLAARLADAVLFVTRWEKTKEAAARTGLENLVDRHTPPIGAVLTQVDVRRHAKRGYGESVQYHSKYAAYYKS